MKRLYTEEKSGLALDQELLVRGTAPPPLGTVSLPWKIQEAPPPSPRQCASTSHAQATSALGTMSPSWKIQEVSPPPRPKCHLHPCSVSAPPMTKHRGLHPWRGEGEVMLTTAFVDQEHVFNLVQIDGRIRTKINLSSNLCSNCTDMNLVSLI
jgi:hypothetical protein